MLLPVHFNQLVQLHGVLGVLHRGMSTFPNLDILAQRLLGEMLQRHGSILLAVGLLVGEGDMEGVAGEGLGVEILKGFEDVDGMPHYNLPCDYL